MVFGGVFRTAIARAAPIATFAARRKAPLAVGVAMVGGGALAVEIASRDEGAGLIRALADSGSAAAAKPVDVTLYQYEVCPYCCKVKAFLDANDVPYRAIEVNPLTKAEIKFSDEYRKVPIALIGEEQVNESSKIIDAVRTRRLRFEGGGIKYGAKVPEGDEAAWFGWVDDVLVHTLPPNIYRTPGEAIQAFEYIQSNGNWPGLQRYAALYVGAAAMYLISKRLKKRHGITDERTALYNAIGEWNGVVGTRDFHGGAEPDSADLAVFGVLRSIEGLDTFDDMVGNTDIKGWYSRMEEAVGETSRVSMVVEPSPDFRAEVRRVKN